jgi:hypothetical protein
VRNRVCVGLSWGLYAAAKSLEDRKGEIRGERMRDNWQDEIDECPEIPMSEILVGDCNRTQTLHKKVNLRERKGKRISRSLLSRYLKC